LDGFDFILRIHYSPLSYRRRSGTLDFHSFAPQNPPASSRCTRMIVSTARRVWLYPKTRTLRPERLLGSGSNHTASISAAASSSSSTLTRCWSHRCSAPCRQSIENATTKLLQKAGGVSCFSPRHSPGRRCDGVELAWRHPIRLLKHERHRQGTLRGNSCWCRSWTPG